MAKRVAFFVLGCKVNQYEVEAMAGIFRRGGYTVVDFTAPAEVLIVHTCAVTAQAEQKSRQVIRQAVRRNPEAVIAVTGCYSQIAADQIAQIPGVDVIIGTAERGQILTLVEAAAAGKAVAPVISDSRQAGDFEELPVYEYASRTRASLKIQEGCDQFCSYCIVPYTRGKVRSRALGAIVAEAERLVSMGFKEIVLTGIHLGAYGKDLPEPLLLTDVLAALQAVPGLARLRISSIEPTEISDRLLAQIAGSAVICRHLHIPLQSGDDTVLGRMNRRYSAAEFRAVIDRVRAAVPDIGLSTDIIVGFPGETDEQFENTYALAAAVGFGHLHVFQYSRRTGTPAAKLPDQVLPAVKEARSKRLIALSEEMAERFHARFIGKEMPVLAEHIDPRSGLLEGLTDNYIRVFFPGAPEQSGELIPVRITAVAGSQVRGEPV